MSISTQFTNTLHTINHNHQTKIFNQIFQHLHQTKQLLNQLPPINFNYLQTLQSSTQTQLTQLTQSIEELDYEREMVFNERF